MYKIGVDLGGTKIAAGITDEANRILAAAHTPTRPERGVQAVISDVVVCIDNALLLAGISPEECSGIGIGCPGLCGGGRVYRAHNLGWENVPLGEALTAEYGLKAAVANDADCACLGERLCGSARGAENVVMITLGTGVGCGMVIGGKMYSGTDGLGGEAGHMCICLGGERCTCGQRGCWEAYASATALIGQARRAAEGHPESALSSAELDGEKIFALAAAGDIVSKRVVSQYAEYVAAGLVNIVNLVYPEVIVIGGGVGQAGEQLLKPVRDSLSAHIFAAGLGRMPRLVQAMLGAGAGIVGAAALCGAGEEHGCNF